MKNAQYFAGAPLGGSPAAFDLRTTGRGPTGEDDSATLKAYLTRLREMRGAGTSGVLHISAGITGTNGSMPTIAGLSTILRDGPHASYIVFDRLYAGDLFSRWEASKAALR